MDQDLFERCSAFISGKGCLTCMTLINMIGQQDIAILKALNMFYNVALLRA